MKTVRSFKNVWDVTRSLYFNIGSICFQFSFVFIGFWVAAEAFMFVIGSHLPLPPTFDNPLVRYVVIPCGIAFFMDKKTFDDRRPYHSLRSIVVYAMRPKYTYLGKRVVFRKEHLSYTPTIVRHEVKAFEKQLIEAVHETSAVMKQEEKEGEET